MLCPFDTSVGGPGCRPSSGGALGKWLLTGVLVLCSATSGLGGTFTVFGRETYIRDKESPVTVVKRFSVSDPSATYTIRIYNGGLEDDAYERVSSSVISINGTSILTPSELNQNV